MRQVGTLPSIGEAERFTDYLLTRDIDSKFEEAGDGFEIWIRSEDKIDEAREEFDAFKTSPADAKYDASPEARVLRQEKVRKHVEAKKNYIEMRGRWSDTARRRQPLVMTLIGLSIFVFLMTGSMGGGVVEALEFTRNPYQPFRTIAQGQVWRIITPIFLHGGLLHLLFNMYWMYYLGSQIEARKGTWMFGLLVFVLAAGSNSCEMLYAWWTLDPGSALPRLGGMSGVDYGLLGYIWMKMRYEPSAGMFVSEGVLIIMLCFMVLGFMGLFDTEGVSIANWAHLSGLLLGMAAGYAPVVWKR